MKYNYTIYGTATCGQCRICKKLFDQKGIKYRYVDITTLENIVAETVMEFARKEGKGSLPIVMDEATGKVVDWRRL